MTIKDNKTDKIKEPLQKPSAQPVANNSPEADPTPRPDPVRYGDWEKNGRCIDF